MDREKREALLNINAELLQKNSCGLSLIVYGLLGEQQKNLAGWDNFSDEEKERAAESYRLYRETVKDTLDAWKDNAETDDLYAIGCREMRQLLRILPIV